ncbi:MAG: coproporphyrinogen III oxidase, partial [Ginsengibacter sp.]
MNKTRTKEYRDEWIELIHHLQDTICQKLEEVDGMAKFFQEEWQRAEGKGGGGVTRIIQNGNIFEKGGVNTSVVYGEVTDKMRKFMNLEGETWFACGISSVLHPVNPFVPTIHFNYRMFELYNEKDEVSDMWFGGGTDLTPYYLFKEDAKHFHQTYRNVCDEFDPSFYPDMKITCDNYFINTHRNNERRGIGGIFYDYKRDKAHPDLP